MDWAEKRSWKEDHNGAQWLGLAFGFFWAFSGSPTSAMQYPACAVFCSPLAVLLRPTAPETKKPRCVIRSRASQAWRESHHGINVICKALFAWKARTGKSNSLETALPSSM